MNIEFAGGKWFIITSVEGMWAAMNENYHHPDVYSTVRVQKLLDLGKSTILF